MKTKDTIERKWLKKTEDMKRLAHIKYMMMLERYRRKKEWELARIRVSVEKKEQAYIKKKELEYKRKMLNEIRQMQGKEPKEYKTKSKLNPLNLS